MFRSSGHPKTAKILCYYFILEGILIPNKWRKKQVSYTAILLAAEQQQFSKKTYKEQHSFGEAKQSHSNYTSKLCRSYGA